MIQIQTFIMHDDIFIPITDFQGMIKDRNYVPGSIELQVDGKVIMARNVWDYISDLWPYLLHGIEALLDGQREWETYYPDQPISLAFKVIANNRVAITIDCPENESAVCGKNELVDSMLSAADVFFSNLLRIDPDSALDYQSTLGQLNRLKQRRK